MKKTITEWLDELPDGIKELALTNQKEFTKTASDVPNALRLAFPWESSPQGRDFWLKVYNDPQLTSDFQKEEREWIKHATATQLEYRYGPLGRATEVTPSKAHPHYAKMKEYLEDAAETHEPWTRWHYRRSQNEDWRPVRMYHPAWVHNYEYERIPAPPKTININGFEVPEPCRVNLTKGETYFLVSTSDKETQESEWDDDKHDIRWLRAGLIHKTREAAELHLKALLSFTAVDN